MITFNSTSQYLRDLVEGSPSSSLCPQLTLLPAELHYICGQRKSCFLPLPSLLTYHLALLVICQNPTLLFLLLVAHLKCCYLSRGRCSYSSFYSSSFPLPPISSPTFSGAGAGTTCLLPPSLLVFSTPGPTCLVAPPPWLQCGWLPVLLSCLGHLQWPWKTAGHTRTEGFLKITSSHLKFIFLQGLVPSPPPRVYRKTKIKRISMVPLCGFKYLQMGPC